MNTLKGLILGLATTSLFFSSVEVAEAGNHYAMVCVTNRTSGPIHYTFRWGNGQWKSCCVQPGCTRWHSWKYRCVNQNASPPPCIRYDYDLSVRSCYTRYGLKACAAPCQSVTYAKKYVFRKSPCGCYLKLYAC